MTTSISILIVNEGGNNRSAAVLVGIFVLVRGPPSSISSFACLRLGWLAGWLAGWRWVGGWVAVFIAANILVTSPSHHRAVLHLLHCRCQLMGPCQVEALLFQDLIENIPACVFGGILVKVRPQGARINLLSFF
eukprot:COSAG06_NODE_13390_length_1261_cov_143.916523_2_plen_134_part_00